MRSGQCQQVYRHILVGCSPAGLKGFEGAQSGRRNLSDLGCGPRLSQLQGLGEGVLGTHSGRWFPTIHRHGFHLVSEGDGPPLKSIACDSSTQINDFGD